MTPPVTRPDIEGMLKRAGEATEGPWAVDPATAYPSVRVAASAHATGRYRIASVGVPGRAKDPEDAANAALIAHARTDLPTLCAYALELEATLARVATRLDAICDAVSVDPVTGDDPEPFNQIRAIADELRARK